MAIVISKKQNYYKNVRWGLFMHHESQPSQTNGLSLGEMICLHVPRDSGQTHGYLETLGREGYLVKAVSKGLPILA